MNDLFYNDEIINIEVDFGIYMEGRGEKFY